MIYIINTGYLYENTNLCREYLISLCFDLINSPFNTHISQVKFFDFLRHKLHVSYNSAAVVDEVEDVRDDGKDVSVCFS